MRQAKYLDFPLDEYKVRYGKAKKLMQDHAIDALFLTDRSNVEYFTGFTTISWRLRDKQFYTLIPRDEMEKTVLIVDTVHEGNAENTSWVQDVRYWSPEGKSYIDLTMETICDLELEKATIGMELGHGQRIWMTQMDFDVIKKSLPKANLVDASDLVGKVKAIKSKLEIERIRRACKITCEAIKAGFESFRKGMSERDLSNLMVQYMLEGGADSCYYGNSIGYFSVRANRPAQMTPVPVDREIEKGDIIRVDGGAVYKSYQSDIIRMAIVGEKPSEDHEKLYNALAKAFEATEKVIKPGATPSEIFNRYVDVIRKEGYEKLMPRWTSTRGVIFGHGLGFEIHEEPFLCNGIKRRLEEGMVFAFEQGLKIHPDSLLSLDLEENFLVTKKGCELLSPLERKIWTTSF